MPPRRRQATTQTAEAYNYAGAERLNNPTSETALGMDPEDLADLPIPETEEEEERVRHPRLQWNRGVQTDHSRTFGPLYIHDKISPEQFLKTLTKTNPQRDMWVLLNGLPEDAAAKPYEYSGHWTNRLIRATAQRAMASLLYKDGMRGKVNLIYLDPPYNKSFRSNFQASADTPETEEDWDDLPNDPVAIKAFRDTYRDGVHSYLDGLYEQLTLGRELLAEDGSFIVQIGPDNVHEVVLLMAEVFGRENHVATIAYTTRANSSTRMIPEIGNWLVWFSKTKADAKYRRLYEERTIQESIAQMGFDAMYTLPDGTSRTIPTEDLHLIPKEATIFRRMPLDSSHESATGRSEPWEYNPSDFPDRPNHYPDAVRVFPCPPGRQWSVSLEGLNTIASLGRIEFSGERPSFRRYINEVPGRILTSMWGNLSAPQDKQYVVETPTKVLERCLLMTTDPGDLVLDLTCGSGAMPFQAETWGRRWIAIDVAQVSIAIARERLITNTYPYHMLKDSPEGAKLDHEMEQALLPEDERTEFEEQPADTYKHDPQGGFVVERQLRVSAATLAYGHGDEEPIKHPRPDCEGQQPDQGSLPFHR